MFDDIFSMLGDGSGLEDTFLSEQDIVQTDTVSSSDLEKLDFFASSFDTNFSSLENSWQFHHSPDTQPIESDFSLEESTFIPNREGISETLVEGEVWHQPDPENLEFFWSSAQFEGVGDPVEDAQFWQEQTSGTSCAVVAQMGVYESMTGVNLPEDAVCQIAEVNGWYDPYSGTQPDALGKVLNAFGVSTEASYDATLVDIADALERGEKVIVALDANEIWEPLREPLDGTPVEQPDGGHAVWVTGIETHADGNVTIILNDSGIPDGRMKAVDAMDFLNAWQDFGNHLVVAKAPVQPVIV